MEKISTPLETANSANPTVIEMPKTKAEEKKGRGLGRPLKTIPVPLAIECVRVRHMVFLNDGRPVLIQGAKHNVDAFNKVQAMIDAGKL